MRSRRNPRLRGLSVLVAAVLAVPVLAASKVRACTVVVLTDGKHAFFCNNEDWKYSKTRIWFQTGENGNLGAVYVGFDDGWPQGGLNTAGLAYDWVMMSMIPQPWELNLPSARGRSCQRLLETCTTVKDAVAFYRKYGEGAFSTLKLLVADKSGASAIIGLKDGQLQVEESDQTLGFGFGGKGKLGLALARRAALSSSPEASATEGLELLQLSRQAGTYATRYSNVFDLKSGDIFLRSFHGQPVQTVEIRLNLTDELKKGDHYYDMPVILEQSKQAPRPLPKYMRRFPLDEYKPIPDKEPKVTAHVAAILSDEARGAQREEDFTEELWDTEVVPNLERGQAELKRLGELVSITLVEREESARLRSYRYRTEFPGGVRLLHVVFDAKNKVTTLRCEAFEPRPRTKAPKP
jgi:hypothetical protein